MKFIDLERQYLAIRDEIESRISTVLGHGRFILGPEVAEFEQRLAAFAGAEYAVGVANGTDAMTLSLMALGIGPGDAVFVPTFSFFATAEVVNLVGATPIFVDIDERTYGLDPVALEESIQLLLSRGDVEPKGVIAVDLFGGPADYDGICAVTNRFGLHLIEDGAQGFGGSLRNKRLCSFGDVATTSFFPAKPLGCYGDGGAVFTNDGSLADLIRSLRVHGQGEHKYDNVRVGMNSRLDTLQAAVLLAKLTIFEEELRLRDRVARYYTERLKEDFVVPDLLPDSHSAYAQYTIRPRFRNRNYYLGRLKEDGIPYAIYYPKPLHQQPVYQGNFDAPLPLRVAERVSTEVFSLPMHPYLTEAECDCVISALEGSGCS